MKKKKLAPAKFEEIRVQVSISYELDFEKADDDMLPEMVKDVGSFKVYEQQRYGYGQIPLGFIIFQGRIIPTENERELMVKSVNNGLQMIYEKYSYLKE